MQASDFNPWLENAVAEVLESMCFFSTAGDAADQSGASGGLTGWICGKLDFRGVPCGSFGLGVPPQTALTMAANFLGEEEHDISDTQIVEVICELTNMVCGTLLSHLEPKRTFDLSSPVRHSFPQDAAPQVDRIARTFVLDEGVLHAWLEIRGRI